MNEQTMIHVEFPQSMTLLTELYNAGLLDCFYVTMRPFFTSCDSMDNGIAKTPIGRNMCITFEYASDDSKGRHALWEYLLKYGCEVIWKDGEKNKGYIVDSKLHLIEPWDLDDGMS